MKAGNKTTGIRLRAVLASDVALGPGKADILFHIKETGSISAAGRCMGMSYKRAWSLVEGMNKDFQDALVTSSKGGRGGGGAQLTEMGERVLTLYRTVEEKSAKAAASELDELQSLLSDMSQKT